MSAQDLIAGYTAYTDADSLRTTATAPGRAVVTPATPSTYPISPQLTPYLTTAAQP